MNIINFDQSHCQGVRAQLDSYIKGELAIATGRDVSTHLEACGECAAEMAARRRLKTALQHAVKQDVAPPALQYRIQREIRRQKHGFAFLTAPWQRWMLAAAATVVLAIGGWGIFQASRSDNPEAPLLAVTAAVTAEDLNLLNVGLGNHTHCAVEKGLAQKRFTDEEMKAKLGDGFAGLVPLVRDKVSDGFTVVVGHTCRFQKREFVHLVLRRDEEVVSLTITRKQGEAFSGGAAASAASGSLPLRAARMEEYEVTGFETRDYLAFVISNLPKRENGSLAAAVGPVVRDFLAAREA